MKRLLLFLFCLTAIASAQRTGVRNGLYFPATDSLKLRLYGNNDTTYLKSSSSGQVLTLGKRTRAPYSSGNSVVLEMVTPDADSTLATVILDGLGDIYFSASGKARMFSDEFKFKKWTTGSASPVITFHSASDSAYLLYTEAGNSLRSSKPLNLPNGRFASSSLDRNLAGVGDTLLWGTSTGYLPIWLGGASSGQALAWDGGAWVPTTIVGGGFGGGADSVMVFQLSNNTSSSSVVDTVEFNYQNFSKANSAGNTITFNTIQDIHTTANPTFDSLSVTKGIDVNGASSSIYLASIGQYNTVVMSSTQQLAGIAPVATGNALISGGISALPSYGKIGLTTHVSGTLPASNGGTGITTTPVAGGLVYGNGSTQAYSAVGTSNYYLTSGGTGAPVWVNLLGTANAWTANQTHTGTTGNVMGSTATTGNAGVFTATSGIGVYANATTGNAFQAAISGSVKFQVGATSISATLPVSSTGNITLAGDATYPALRFTEAISGDTARIELSSTGSHVKVSPSLEFANNTDTPVARMVSREDDTLKFGSNKLLDESDVKDTLYMRGDSIRTWIPGARPGDRLMPFWISININGALVSKVVANDTVVIYSTYIGEPDSAMVGILLAARNR